MMESKISRTLSDQTIKVVLILVLSLLFVLPFLQTDFYTTEFTIQEQGLKMLADVYNNVEDWSSY
jgi:hypothetical protein